MIFWCIGIYTRKKAVLKSTTTAFSIGDGGLNDTTGERGIAIENLKKLVRTTSFDVVMGYYCIINQGRVRLMKFNVTDSYVEIRKF